MKTFKEYLTEKNISEEVFKAKDFQDQAELHNEFNDSLRADINVAIEAKASKEDIDSLKAELSNVMDQQMKSLNAVLAAQGVVIKKLSNEEKEVKLKSFSDSIKDGLSKNIDGVKTMNNGWLTFKAAGTMTSANVSGGNVPVEQRLEGVDDLASRRVRLFDIISRGSSTSPLVSWVSKANRDGAAGGTAEGVAKNQVDFDLVVDSETAKKRTAFIKVSTEMLNDIAFIESEIKNELMVELMKDIEAQVYEGDGTGTNLNGIRTVASAFAAVAPFGAASVDNANEADVLVAAANIIEVADQETPNAILMNPADVNKLRAIKVSTTDKRYVDRLLNVGSSMSLDGIPIIKSTMVTQDEYLIGYFPNALMLDHEALEIQMGLDADDFTKNLRTIIAEWRGMVIVKTNKRASFVAGVFTTDIAAITV